MKDTPVLLLVFNRPGVTQNLFDAIRLIQPPKLYIVADGPRSTVEGELELCNSVRAIFEQIDWPCEVRKLYRENNMGCDPSIMDGISWFFKHEEQGIILEDDCIPSHSFYDFCQLLLNKYKNDRQIAMIGGSNFFDKPFSRKYDYYIGDFMHTWGWATWRYAWEEIDWNERYSLPQVKRRLLEVYKDERFVTYFFNNIQLAYTQKVPHWDAIFFIHNIISGKKGILPALNQISNIGKSGTHFKDSKSILLHTRLFEIKMDKDVADNYCYLGRSDLKRLIDNYNRKIINLSIRDRLYLCKIKMKQFLGFKK